MIHPFDVGYAHEPFSDLCSSYPSGKYPASDFRVEWGPVFHRGRLDGTARVLVLGQDPAAHEVACRRILVGVAGRRIQGFLAKLGFTHSYVMINTFAYCQYHGDESQYVGQRDIAAYRAKWLDALLVKGQIRAVVALGHTADRAWHTYAGSGPPPFYRKITHPTEPHKDAHGDPVLEQQLTAAMLRDWNDAIILLRSALRGLGDEAPDRRRYLATFRHDELPPIPPCDLPAGLPEWMGTDDNWAHRTSVDVDQRWQITVTVPARYREASRRIALRGRIVTMAKPEIIRDGTVFIEDSRIVAVQPAKAPPPPGFEQIASVDTKGTIFPGLIDLHNHPQYNILSPWFADRKFQHRESWLHDSEYYRLVSQPMHTARKPKFAPSVARYVECKQLLAGVTAGLGVRLADGSGAERPYAGIVRNIELPNPDLAAMQGAAIQVFEPIDQAGIDLLKSVIDSHRCTLLHLSEGTDLTAYAHFQFLRAGRVLGKSLGAVHCVPLDLPDLEAISRVGGSLVWSPYSNLVLYGSTLRIDSARNAGLRIALGADWSITGSRNLLAELKVAKVVADRLGAGLSDRDLISMVTDGPAAMLGWESGLGSLEPGKLADMIVIEGNTADPYLSLIRATEASILLVLVNGVPRVGREQLAGLEEVKVGQGSMYLDLSGADPLTTGLTLANATTALQQMLSNPDVVWPDGPGEALVLEYDPPAPDVFPPEPQGAQVRLNLDDLTVAGDTHFGATMRRLLQDPLLADALDKLYANASIPS